MEENRRPDGYYELVQWRSLWLLIPAAIIFLLMRGCLEHFANMG